MSPEIVVSKVDRQILNWFLKLQDQYFHYEIQQHPLQSVPIKRQSYFAVGGSANYFGEGCTGVGGFVSIT